MAYVVLTRRNLATLKSSLLKTLPAVKSGHADEAIAASVGFKTHAALLTALGAQGSARLVVFLDENVLGNRLGELADIRPDHDTWITIWKEPLPDEADLNGIGKWSINAANQN